MTDTNNHRMAARIFGIFFIITFISYGTGSTLLDALLVQPDFLTNIYTNKTTVITAAILMAVVHTALNIGLAVIMLPIVKPVNASVAYGYFGLAIAASTTLVTGAIFLLMLIPLSTEYVSSGASGAPFYETIGAILKMGGFYAYQIGMALWGIGGLLLVTLLYKSQIIPRPLSLFGLVGYAIFIAGTIAELFGNPIGLPLSIPGGLFEIALSLFLIFRGFKINSDIRTRPGSVQDM